MPAAPPVTPGITCRRSGSQAQTQPRVFSTAAAQPPAAAGLLAPCRSPVSLSLRSAAGRGGHRFLHAVRSESRGLSLLPWAHSHSSWGILQERTPLYLELFPPHSPDTCPALAGDPRSARPVSGKRRFPQPVLVPTNQQSHAAHSQQLEEQTALSLHLGAFQHSAAKPAGALLTTAAAVSLAAPHRGTTAMRWVQVSYSSLICRSTG